MKASIICCYYNELDLVSKKLEGFIEKVKISKLSLEVIIVDNHSTDGTKNTLKELKSKKLLEKS